MNKKISSVVCTVLLCLLLIIPMLSWILLAIGFDVQNVLNADGYRWFFLHAGTLMTPSCLLPVTAFVIMLGSIHASGILTVIRSKHRTVNERLGLTAASAFFVLFFIAFLIPVFRINSALRSVTGQLYPSPWFSCAPYSFAAIVFFSMFLFCVLAKKGKVMYVAGNLLTEGLARYGLWIVNLSLINVIIEIVKYIFY